MKPFIEQIYRNNPPYKEIIFLDRDGTINKEAQYLRNKNQLTLLPTAIEAIKTLNAKNIAVIVITNQPVVGHGIISEDELKTINDALVDLLKNEHAYIDAIYSCPHHPQAELPEYRANCTCRKPGISMHTAALNKYNNPSIIGIVGDQTKDVQAGIELHCKTVLVQTGYHGKDGTYIVSPSFDSPTLLDAVEVLL